MPPQDPDDAQRYVLDDEIQISPNSNSVLFTFTVNRDEPYSDSNLIWINWGVFDGPHDSDISKVYGSRDPYKTEMSLGYSDYFDRVFINYMYLTLGIVGSTTFWGALPLTIVPITVLLFYVFWKPVEILFGVPWSKNFTFNNYFT